MKLVVCEWKKETEDKLIELGFTYGVHATWYKDYSVHVTWYKEYGLRKRFSLILNPIGEPKYTVVIGYSDDDLEDVEEIDECCDMSEIYEDLQLLIDAAIVERR